jgi:hypothetical protein
MKSLKVVWLSLFVLCLAVGTAIAEECPECLEDPCTCGYMAADAMRTAAETAEGVAAAAADNAGMQDNYNEEELLCGAIYWRDQCEGATPQQLAVGNGYIADGDADTALGDADMTSGNSYYSAAETHFGYGEDYMDESNYSSALIYFDSARDKWDYPYTPPAAQPMCAAERYGKAYPHYVAAGQDYQLALDYFEDLAITLGGGMGE